MRCSSIYDAFSLQVRPFLMHFSFTWFVSQPYLGRTWCKITVLFAFHWDFVVGIFSNLLTFSQSNQRKSKSDDFDFNWTWNINKANGFKQIFEQNVNISFLLDTLTDLINSSKFKEFQIIFSRSNKELFLVILLLFKGWGGEQI